MYSKCFLSKTCNPQEINFQNIQAVHRAQNKNNKQSNKNLGRRSICIFLQRRHTDGLEIHAKMLNKDATCCCCSVIHVPGRLSSYSIFPDFRCQHVLLVLTVSQVILIQNSKCVKVAYSLPSHPQVIKCYSWSTSLSSSKHPTSRPINQLHPEDTLALFLWSPHCLGLSHLLVNPLSCLLPGGS